jgi:hypothetical protein
MTMWLCVYHFLSVVTALPLFFYLYRGGTAKEKAKLHLLQENFEVQGKYRKVREGHRELQE